jgi:hypothetical protein
MVILKYHFIKESSVNDPNLIMDFDGLIDLSKKRNSYDFRIKVDYAI